MVHSFSGSKESAMDYIRLGFHLSFSGGICRPGARKVRGAVAAIPSDRLVVETDYPDQAPSPSSDPLNQLTELWSVVEQVALLRGEKVSDVIRQVTENTTTLFRLDTSHSLGNSSA